MTLKKIIQDWDKKKLSNSLDKLYDIEHDTSWTKGRLQGQLLKHSVEDILSICTIQELKTGLSSLGLSTSGKKKDLYERLVEGCNSNIDTTKKSKTKKATSNKSAKTKSTSKATKKKTDDSSLGSKLVRLLEGEVSGFQQGLALFDALDWEDQKSILKNYPISKKEGTTHWKNKRDKVTIRGGEILGKEVDNHFLNIGFVLHALADAPQIISVKSMVLWLNNSMNSDFISLLIKCTSLTKLEFRIPLENNQYDSVQADSLISELQKITKKTTLTSRYLTLIEGGYLFDVIEELTLRGETSEKPYPFTEALTKSVKNEWYFVWGNWYSDGRSCCSIDTQFSSLKKLFILDDPILYKVSTYGNLESLEIHNLPNLTELNVRAPVKKLVLKDVEQLTNIKVNTSQIKQYTLTKPLKNGLSSSVNLKSKSAIETLLQEQNLSYITVVTDSTYGFGFIDEWSHLTHDETWVETINYLFSLDHLLRCAKANIQKFFGQETTENITIGSYSSEIWSQDFDIEYMPFNFGYDMQLHTWARWKNRACNTCPEIKSQLLSNDHSDSEHYEKMKEILVDSDCGFLWDDYIWSEIISFIPKSQYQELEILIQSYT